MVKLLFLLGYFEVQRSLSSAHEVARLLMVRSLEASFNLGMSYGLDFQAVRVLW